MTRAGRRSPGGPFGASPVRICPRTAELGGKDRFFMFMKFSKLPATGDRTEMYAIYKERGMARRAGYWALGTERATQWCDFDRNC